MKLIGCSFLAAAVLMSAAPALAASDVGISNDGSTWGSSSTTTLFDSNFRWVPGDDEVASFYVRNQGPSRALLTITARSADSDQLLANDDISLRARASGGGWVDLQNGVATDSLTEQSMSRGEVVRVDVNAIFDPTSTNQSQRKEFQLAFDVTLTDSLEDAGGHDGGWLPDTGSAAGPMVLIVAATFMACGLLVLRRRDEEVHDG